MADGRTVIWISGASGGIGGALARQHPFPDAKIINLDIVPSPDFRTIRFDLRDPASWLQVRKSFDRELENLGSGRALFLHSAYWPGGKGVLSHVDPDDYQTALFANVAGVLSIAAAFVRAVRPENNAGLMVMSSGAAQSAPAGYSAYAAAKSAVERWCESVRNEIDLRGWGPWVTAMRPALVDTLTAREASQLDPDLFPLGASMRRLLETRSLDADTAAKRIWAAIAERPSDALIVLNPRRS